MIGWLITAAILILLWFLPLGIRVIYNQNGIFADLLIGLIPVRVYPGKKKTDGKSGSEDRPAKTKKQKSADQKDQAGGSYKDFVPLVKMIVAFLGDFRRKLLIKRLEMKLVLAGDDPCDLAVNYGKAWAAVGNLMPLIEQIFVIRKSNLQVHCDFLAETIKVTTVVDITITVGRLVGLAVKYGVLALQEYLKLKKAVL